MLGNKKGTFWACCAIKSTSEKSYIPRATSNSVSASTRKIMYLTASSTAVGTRFTQRYIVRFQLRMMDGLITSELQKNAQSSLEIRRTLYDICSQDRVNVLFYVLPFESFPHSITKFRYYLWWLRTLAGNGP